MEKHRRKNLRLPFYDYSQYGCYFVTICTYNREKLFGEIVNGEVKLNHIGKIVYQSLFSVLNDYSNSEISSYVIMPNHLHFIWFNQDNADLSMVVKKIKGRASFHIGKLANEQGVNKPQLWQRSFYEHIIRDDKDYDRIAEYIENNPIMWELDRFYS